jgi:hypothetical protein
MPDTLHKLYGTAASAVTDGAASLDIRGAGKIGCIVADIDLDCTTDNGYGRWEISFASSSAHTTNDTLASLAGGQVTNNFTTSGQASLGRTVVIPCDIAVQGGERVYLHLTGSSGTIYVRAWLFVQYKVGGQFPAATRRV